MQTALLAGPQCNPNQAGIIIRNMQPMIMEEQEHGKTQPWHLRH